MLRKKYIRRKSIEGEKQLFHEGDFIFLKGEDVLEKLVVGKKTATGYYLHNVITKERSFYESPVPFFTIGNSLFKGGLPAYPFETKGLEAQWMRILFIGQATKKMREIDSLYKDIKKKNQNELFCCLIVLCSAIDTVQRLKLIETPSIVIPEAQTDLLIKRMYDNWKKGLAGYEKVIDAMDSLGLLQPNLHRLNVGRKKK